MSKWGDPRKFESPDREAVRGAKREVSILLSGSMLWALVLALIVSAVAGTLMVAWPIVLIGAFLGPPLSVIGLINARGRARYVAASLTITTFLIYGIAALVLL